MVRFFLTKSVSHLFYVGEGTLKFKPISILPEVKFESPFKLVTWKEKKSEKLKMRFSREMLKNVKNHFFDFGKNKKTKPKDLLEKNRTKLVLGTDGERTHYHGARKAYYHKMVADRLVPICKYKLDSIII